MSINENYSMWVTSRLFLSSDGTPYTGAGPIQVAIMLADDGHADDGKFWSTASGGQWDTFASATFPTATERGADSGIWSYEVPAAAFTGHAGVNNHIVVAMSDDIDTPGSATCQSGPTTYMIGDDRQMLIADLIESQRKAHTWQGTEYLYVDPTNGNDSNAGTRDLPKATVTSALSSVTDSAHSVIFLVAGASGGPTTLTEAVTVNKRYTFIRGPGRDFIWTRSGNGATITITADGCEISGCRIQTAATGNGSGIAVNSGADFAAIRGCWFEDTQGDGITITDASNCIIEDCVFEESGQVGAGRAIDLQVSVGSVDHTFIRRCHISNSPNDGIRLGGTGVEDTVIHDCSIHGSGGYGINIATGSLDTLVYNVFMGQNTSGNYLNSGTNTTFLLPATSEAGTNSITIHVQDGDSAAIQGAVVTVRDSADTALRTVGTTDSDGDYELALDSATYKLHIVASGYSFTDPETIVVSADATFTITGTEITTSTPASPDGCVVYGTIKYGVTAHANLTVKMYELVEGGPQVEDSVIMSNQVLSTTTDANGYFEQEMAAGTKIVVDIPEAGITHTIELPDATSYDISDEWD